MRESVPDPLTDELVVRCRTEISLAAVQRLTRPGLAVRRR